MTAETQIRINLADIRDYISMRKAKQASNVAWNTVKHLNVSGGGTFWQMFDNMENYDCRYEPSMKHLTEISMKLNLNTK